LPVTWNNSSLFQYLWDGLMVGVCVVDQQGAIQHLNGTGSRLLGWGAVCPSDLSLEDVFAGSICEGEEVSNYHALFSMLKERKVAWLPRARLYCRHGTSVWVELKGVVVEDGEGTHFLFMFRDLSSETQLAEEYSRLASIPEESPFPIIEVNAVGHLLYANPTMVRLMEDANIGQDGFTTALPKQFPALAARCLSQGHLASNIEVQVGEKYFAWSFSSHPELGRLRGYGMDITDSKRASEELSRFAETLEIKNQELDQALVKAEAATRAKAAFLATMSHEIRTPLNGVIGMAELLLKSSLDIKQQECTKIIRKSGEGLLEIINDILDFSKIESGHMALETIGFNPVSLAEEVLDLFSERAYHKGLDLAAFVAPDIPRHLFGDPHRLRQILCNFVANALKFTSHGSVLVEVAWLSPGENDAATNFEGDGLNEQGSSEDRIRFVRFSVKDTGIGIEQSMQKKIFQVFTQADSSMSRKFGGSGLGLAICKQLAELMNGTVGVDSQMGKGSTFWCDLPFPFSGQPMECSVEPRCQDILVCSSPSASTEVVFRYLHDYGIRVTQVNQVDEAVAFFHRKGKAPSEVLGIIIGREVQEEHWRTWLESVRVAPFSELKLWGLTPFWVRNMDSECSVPFDGMVTIPIHRDQLYRCVLNESPVSASRNEFDQPEAGETKASKSDIPQNSNSLDHSSNYEKEEQCPSVLIVEDNPVNQKVAVGLLEKLGCHVYVAETGTEALNRVQASWVDLVLMDWELPGMDGFETARGIRELEQSHRLAPRSPWSQTQKASASLPCLHLPIVGMTAHRFSERNPSRWDSVMDDCLAKPFHSQDLAMVLERWVGIGLPFGGRRDSGEPSSPETSSTKINTFVISDEVGVKAEQPIYCGDYDYSAALDCMEGDQTLLHSLFKIFLETWPKLEEGMREAIAVEDRQCFEVYVHQLKGALFALNANHQGIMAERLEIEASAALFSDLQGRFEEMVEGVTTLVTLFREKLLVRSEK